MADVSGTVYDDQGVTPMGSGRTLNISINGAASAGSTTTGGDGTYSFTGLTIASGDVLAIYIQDGVNPEKALTVTKGTGSNMTGIDLWRNFLTTRSDNGVSLTSSNLDTANNNGATGITSVMSGATATAFSTATGYGLHIPAGQSLTFGTATTTINGATFICNGSFTAAAGTVVLARGTSSHTLKTNGSSFVNLTIQTAGPFTVVMADALSVTTTLTVNTGQTLDANGYSLTVGFNLTIASTATLLGRSSTISVGNNWSCAGTFTPGTSTVSLNRANGIQQILHSTTFYNLTATAAAARTLTFTDGTTTTVTNSLTLTGSAGQLLTLGGSSTGGWTLAVPATQSLGYLSVSRSTATGNTALAGSTSTDGGNNTNWNFGPPVNSVAPSCAPSSGTVADTFTFAPGTWTGSPTSYETSVSVDGGAYAVIDTSAGGAPSKTGTQLGGPGSIATRVRAQNAGGWSGYVAGTTLTVTAGGDDHAARLLLLGAT